MMPLAEGAGRRLVAASSSGRAIMLPKEVRCGFSDIMCRVTRGQRSVVHVFDGSEDILLHDDAR